MMLLGFKKVTTVLVILFLSFSFGCSQSKNPANEIYGEDTHYFLGLQAAKEGDWEKAKKSFLRCSQKGSYYPARRSFEQLCLIGNVQEKTKMCSELLKKYDDNTAKIFACKEFIQDKEYTLALQATEGIDLAAAPNELVRLWLDVMEQKKDARLNQTIYDWFTKRRISLDHYNFYKDKVRDEFEEVILGAAGEGYEGISEFERNLNIVQQFRIAIYRGSYNAAFAMLEEIRDLTVGLRIVPLTYQLVADMGRACVNGSKENIPNAKFFESLAEDKNFSDKQIKYYALIYSGLLYNKNDNYRRRALKQFEAAIPYAAPGEEYDQAVWYYLQSCLKISVEEAVSGLQKYCAAWNTPSYFDDFFDSLSVLLFSGGKWNAFAEVYSIVKHYASPATVSKFAYLTGRLMQEDFIEGGANQIEAAFKEAANCDTGTYVYYKLLAAKRLEYSTEQIEKLFFEKTADSIEKPEIDSKTEEAQVDARASANRLLLGYADFGFGEKIYDEWQVFFEQDNRMIDMETTTRLSVFLRALDDGQNDCYSKSLRMISKAANLDGQKISREAFALLYPQNFSAEVSAACSEFEIADYVMYALIRTESFFEPKVQSHAGAIGLTQLLASTAADCAARLKVSEYDLRDPAINVRFGTYYFSNLASRLDGSQILALFAYNAGITNVRRWVRGSKIQLEARSKISSDLFLETLPFGETRDYGRRVISAAAMYAWLYDGINPCDVVSEMM